MLSLEQIRRLAILDSLIEDRIEPRENIMQRPRFRPGLDDYLEEYMAITATSHEISKLLLRFGISQEKRKSIFFRLVQEHARFVGTRFIPLVPFSDPEALLFYVTAMKRKLDFSTTGRMLRKSLEEEFSPGMLMDSLWRHFEAGGYKEECEWEL